MAITNEQKRQQSGRDMEEARRASGRKMRDDMRALAENNRLERTLPVLPVRGKQPAKRGSAVWQGGVPSSGGGGGGIASPLTEKQQEREYFEQDVVMSIDGVIAVAVRRPKKIFMRDADGDDVTLEFSDDKP